jgi:hypothetical protein
LLSAPTLVISMNPALPTGQVGRLLALSVTLVVLLVGWFAVASPLLDWYADRAEHLALRRVLVRRTEVIAQTLPELRQAAARDVVQARATSNLLDGGTDAIAAAALLQWVQDAASRTGTRLSSTEALPATPTGADRRIGVHVAFNAPWPMLIKLLQAVEQAAPRMLIDDLQIHERQYAAQPLNTGLDAGFTILAFRSGGAPGN